MSTTIDDLWWLVADTVVVIALTIISALCRAYNGSIKCSNITKIACRDLSHVGKYDEPTSVSIRYWIYAIQVYLYTEYSLRDSVGIFLKWNERCNYDPKDYISSGIMSANDLFNKNLQEAEDAETEPRFSVSSCYDYHDIPKSFMYNDYIDTESLLKDIDCFERI